MPPLKLVRPPLLCAKNAGAVSPPRRKNVPVLPGSGLVFGYPQQKSSKTEEQVAAQRQASLLLERHRQVAIRMDELAAHMGSEADARSWMRSRICSLAACLLRGHAEYEAVSDPLRQIPEQRIADVWEQIRSRNRCLGRAHCTSTRSDSFRATTSPARTQYSTIYEAHPHDCGRALSFPMNASDSPNRSKAVEDTFGKVDVLLEVIFRFRSLWCVWDPVLPACPQQAG